MILSRVTLNVDPDHAQDDDNNSGDQIIDQFYQTRKFGCQGLRKGTSRTPSIQLKSLICQLKSLGSIKVKPCNDSNLRTFLSIQVTADGLVKRN